MSAAPARFAVVAAEWFDGERRHAAGPTTLQVVDGRLAEVLAGDHPQARPVLDLDAVSLPHIARAVCDCSELASGGKPQTPPALFIDAPANPFVPPFVDRVALLETKIVAVALRSDPLLLRRADFCGLHA